LRRIFLLAVALIPAFGIMFLLFVAQPGLDLQNPRPLMWHYGDTTGFKTAILRYLHEGVTVIVLCNRTDLDAGALALKAAPLTSGSR
jgi:hypothetical protein